MQPQLVCAQQQFGEIHQPGPLAGALVGLVDVDQCACHRISRNLDHPRAFALVLGRVDEPAGLARWEAGLVDAQTLDGALDHALLVIRVENLEGFRQLRFAPMATQQAMGNAVEGADGQAAQSFPHQGLGARAHFRRRLVGEGDGKNGPRRSPLDLQQPADAMGEYARLAGTCAGQHQIVARRRTDGFTLRGVELVQQVGDISRQFPVPFRTRCRLATHAFNALRRVCAESIA